MVQFPLLCFLHDGENSNDFASGNGVPKQPFSCLVCVCQVLIKSFDTNTRLGEMLCSLPRWREGLMLLLRESHLPNCKTFFTL